MDHQECRTKSVNQAAAEKEPQKPGIENVLVCGRGSVGLSLGGRLADHLASANFAYLASEQQARRYAKQPVLINGEPRIYRYVTPAEEQAFENGRKADLVLFACKSYSLDEAMEEAAPFVEASTILVSAINGIASEERLQTRFPHNPIVHAIAQNMDARYDSARQSVRFTTPGELVFGPASPAVKEQADALEELLARCEVPYIRSADIRLDQARKLMFNCGINQVCAAYSATYGDVASDPVLNDLLLRAMEEARKSLAVVGTDPGQASLQNWAEKIKTFDPDSMPSMAQDVLAGRKMELDLFCGTILPLARKYGVETPVLEDLNRRLQALMPDESAGNQ